MSPHHWRHIHQEQHQNRIHAFPRMQSSPPFIFKPKVSQSTGPKQEKEEMTTFDQHHLKSNSKV